MEYGQKADARMVCEMMISDDEQILDRLLDEHFSGSVVLMIKCIWNEGIYQVMTQAMQSKEQDQITLEVEDDDA